MQMRNQKAFDAAVSAFNALAQDVPWSRKCEEEVWEIRDPPRAQDDRAHPEGHLARVEDIHAEDLRHPVVDVPHLAQVDLARYVTRRLIRAEGAGGEGMGRGRPLEGGGRHAPQALEEEPVDLAAVALEEERAAIGGERECHRHRWRGHASRDRLISLSVVVMVRMHHAED